MPKRDSALMQRRNNKIKDRCDALLIKHPKWRYSEIINELVEEFFLEPFTIRAILGNNCGYGKTG